MIGTRGPISAALFPPPVSMCALHEGWATGDYEAFWWCARTQDTVTCQAKRAAVPWKIPSARS